MKILVIHNCHRDGSASGDDQVFSWEVSLLREHGHKVVTYSVSNDSFDQTSTIKKPFVFLSMIWSAKHYNRVKRLIKKVKPDIVHVHNLFPLISPAVLYAAKRSHVPVVATLHDSRLACPCATSIRDGQICNKCTDGHYFRMCKYRCFKESKLWSMAVAMIFKYHRMRKTFYKQIDRYICLNDSQIRLMEHAGIDGNKVIKKYNFVPDSDSENLISTMTGLPEKYVVFFGRIGPEKGVDILMKTWEKLDIPLVIMGGGPMEHKIEKWAENKDNIYYLGYVKHKECMSVVKAAEFVVFPSITYEGCPMTIIESMSLSKGTVSTDLGFSREAIRNGYNGYKFPHGDSEKFIDVVKALWNSPEECKKIGINARKEYEKKYTPAINYKELLEIYEKLKNKA